MRKLIIHLVSERSGQSVRHISDTVLAKFSKIEVKRYYWPMIKNEKMLSEALDTIRKKPGVVLYTIANSALRKILKKNCYELKIPCISAVSRIVQEISDYVGIKADEISVTNKFDDQYFTKVEAIEYTLKHDDGKTHEDLENADIILIGASRTSKTPTSIYLAYNGFKTANIPYIYNCPFPTEIENLKNPLIFGLLINPSRLIEIRENRINLLKLKNIENYTDFEIIQEEYRKVKTLCIKNSWQVIDVSTKSIEETAAIIMREFYAHKIRMK
ncbi:MAG: kinase/pyrophosphorylase [Rickettsiaceae bacterium]|nr:kinase/pyrophosphorylase [Rickettsiaceae bacterium]